MGLVGSARAAPSHPFQQETDIHRPTVFVHGTRTSSAIWVEQTRALQAAGHPCVAVDLPGHGARSGERFTLDGALAVIREAVESCSQPPLLVGLSLGGYASLAFASRHQGLVAGVLLAGCCTEIKGKPLSAYRRASTWLNGVLHWGGDSWHVVADMLTALTGYSPLSDLAGLEAPLWLVNGRRDPLRLDERRYLRTVPHARLTVVPGAGHDVNTHAPQAFNRVLLDALHELRTPALAPA